MKKAAVLSAMAIVLAFAGQAQTSRTKSARKKKSTQKITHFDLHAGPDVPTSIKSFQKIKDGYVFLRGDYSDGFQFGNCRIEKLDKNFKSIYLEDFGQEFDNNPVDVLGLYVVRNKGILVTHTTQKFGPKLCNLYAYQVDLSTGELGDRQTVFTHAKTKRTYPVIYDVSVSPNQNQILFSFRSPLADLKKRKAGIAVYNAALELQWSKLIDDMVQGKRTYDIMDLKLDNESNVYAMLAHRDEVKKRYQKRNFTNTSFNNIYPAGVFLNYEVVKYSEDDERRMDLEVSDDKEIDVLALRIGRKGQVAAHGYYYAFKGDCPQGVVTILLEKDLKGTLKRTERGLCDDLTKKQRRALKRSEGADFEVRVHAVGSSIVVPRTIQMRKFVSHNNGDYSLIGETYFITAETGGDLSLLAKGGGGQRKEAYFANYEHLFITRFNKEGRFLNNTTINKLDKKRLESALENGLAFSPRYIANLRNSTVVFAAGKKKELLEYGKKKSKRKKGKKKKTKAQKEKEKKAKIVLCHQVDRNGGVRLRKIVDMQASSYKKMELPNPNEDIYIVDDHLIMRQDFKKTNKRLEIKSYKKKRKKKSSRKGRA